MAAALVVALFAAGLAAPSEATGADGDELIREGVALRRQSNDAEALKKFQQAFEANRSPRALAQMGLAEQALGRWVSAYEHLAEALQAKSDAWIAKNRGTIDTALSAVGDHVGQIEILGGAPGAEVRIDGVRRGALPLKGPLTMTTGSVTIDVSAPGFVPVQRTAVVHARQISRESFEPLAPVSERAPVSSTRSDGGPATAAAVNMKKELAPLPPPASTGATPQAAGDGNTRPIGAGPPDTSGGAPSPIRGAAKWMGWGLGAASAGLGLFGYLKQNSAADDFGKGCVLDATGMVQPLPTSTKSTQGCRDLQSSVDSNFRLEVIGLVGAAVFAAAGFALWLTEPGQGADGHSTAVACFPEPTAGGGMAVGCSLRL